MSEPRSNLGIRANVMLTIDPDTRVEFSARQRISYLPGDFAFQVYRSYWPDPRIVRRELTDLQWQEYEQNLVCLLCGRPCAGTCSTLVPRRRESGP